MDEPKQKKMRHYEPKTDRAHARIVTLMLDNEWEPSTHTAELAERFGLTEHALRNVASNASRFIRLSSEFSRDKIRTRILLGIDRGERLSLDARKIVYDAEDKKFRSCGQPDLVAYARFLSLRCDVYGLLEHKRDAPQETQDVSLEELQQVVERLGFNLVRRDDGK